MYPTPSIPKIVLPKWLNPTYIKEQLETGNLSAKNICYFIVANSTLISVLSPIQLPNSLIDLFIFPIFILLFLSLNKKLLNFANVNIGVFLIQYITLSFVVFLKRFWFFVLAWLVMQITPYIISWVFSYSISYTLAFYMVTIIDACINIGLLYLFYKSLYSEFKILNMS